MSVQPVMHKIEIPQTLIPHDTYDGDNSLYKYGYIVIMRMYIRIIGVTANYIQPGIKLYTVPEGFKANRRIVMSAIAMTKDSRRVIVSVDIDTAGGVYMFSENSDIILVALNSLYTIN